MAGKLTAMKVRALTKPGRYGDGNGLWLQVRDADRRSWLFRYKLNGRARAMGLGAISDVSLAEAREAAEACRKLLREGIDPVERRRVERTKAVAPDAPTFREVAEGYIAAHSAGWRNVKHRQQWRNTLEAYAFPVLGDLAITAVDIGGVMRVLEPLWHKKTETASRLRGRIESVLDYATARGWRTGENPARWRGHLQKLLPARSKVQRIQHHAALPWRRMGEFMAELRQHDGIAARALEFTILTAARTGEVIGARWQEIDGDVWTVPGERMKAGREHRVPLSGAAIEVLRAIEAARGAAGAWVFPGGKTGRPLSSMAFLMLLRRMRRADLTAHGFRSTFREWAAEATELSGAPENDNTATDAVACILTRIAEQRSVALLVLHHFRKGAAIAGDMDAARGAKALIDASRISYTLLPMSNEDATAMGVSEEERRRIVRLDDGKINTVLADPNARWYRLASVNIGNGTAEYPNGDNVQAIEHWNPPKTWGEMSCDLLNRILDEIEKGMSDGERYSAAPSAKKRAAWSIVQMHAPNKTEPQCREIIKTWLKTGVLLKEDYDSPKEHKKFEGLQVDASKRPSRGPQ